MSRARGLVLQNALARHLVKRGWIHAESAGSGRNGTDILGTPGIVWECKTADDFTRDFRPNSWVRQAKGHAANGEIPVTVYFPRGIGEQSVEQSLAILPLETLLTMLDLVLEAYQ